MPDDRLRQIFGRIAELPVDIPPADSVRSRGRRRQGRTRLQMSTIAATILLAAGFGGPQVSGSVAANSRPSLRSTSEAAEPEASYPGASGAIGSVSPARHRHAISRRHEPTRPGPSPSASLASNSGALLLPPPGDGQLILALDSAHRYVMTRVGAASAPIHVPGLKAVAGAPPVLATNPAGGWVVSLASQQTGTGVAAARLATVRTTGKSVPFGPNFSPATVTSAAVSLDGSRVAVALAGPSGQARIEVLPLPGHVRAQRSWSVPTAQADLVTGLSWAPDGRHLSYMAGQRAVTGTAASLMTMDTAVSVLPTPAVPRWPWEINTDITCMPVAMAWLGRTGRYAVLNDCPSTGTAVLRVTDAGTGAEAGQPLVVAHQVGCKPAALDPNAAGNRILISYCRIYLDDHGKLSEAAGPLTAAALSGLGAASTIAFRCRTCDAVPRTNAARAGSPPS
jgi:hypothetical protein